MRGMEQEQRRSYRHSLVLETEVHRRDEACEDGMFRCQTENIGLGGVFLPASELLLEKAVDVELVFHIPAATVDREYRMPARVVRTAKNGAGLSFPALDRDAQHRFRLFLMEAKVAGKH